MDEFWIEAEHKALDKAKTLKELVDAALVVLGRMKARGGKIIQICGPMTTGGLNDYEKNMVIFRRVIRNAQKDGKYLVFNQDAFTKAIIRLEAERTDRVEYWMALIDDFYGGIFRSRYFYGTFWIKGWEGSRGAIREREIAEECKLALIDCPEEWYKE